MLLLLFSCKENSSNNSETSNGDVVTKEKNKEFYIEDDFFFDQKVDKKLGENFIVKSFGISEGKKEDDFKIVVILSDFATESSVSKYSFGMQIFLPKEEREKLNLKKEYIDWNFNPKMYSDGKVNYIYLDRRTTIRRIDSIRCYSYDRDNYKGTIGNFWIRDIDL